MLIMECFINYYGFYQKMIVNGQVNGVKNQIFINKTKKSKTTFFQNLNLHRIKKLTKGNKIYEKAFLMEFNTWV